MTAGFIYLGAHQRNNRIEHEFMLNDDAFRTDNGVVLRVMAWCAENIGRYTTSWIAEMGWYVNMGDIYIVDPDHALAFRMRWC